MWGKANNSDLTSSTFSKPFKVMTFWVKVANNSQHEKVRFRVYFQDYILIHLSFKALIQ